MLSIKQLPSLKIHSSIKIIYIIAFIAAMTTNITINILAFINISCNKDGLQQLWTYTATIMFYSYLIALLCVLANIIMRLYLTFKGSMYEISKNQRIFFFVCFVLICLTDIVVVPGYDYLDSIAIIFVIAASIAVLLYFVLSIYGMGLFAVKMYKLAKMKSSSNEDLLYITTKYATLLSFAMISTWICIVLSLSTRKSDIIGIVMNGDMVINILCLFLQFPFNNGYYNAFCSCFGRCCMLCVDKKKPLELQNVASSSGFSKTKTKSSSNPDDFQNDDQDADEVVPGSTMKAQVVEINVITDT